MVDKAEAIIKLMRMVETCQDGSVGPHNSGNQCMMCKPMWLDAIKMLTERLMEDVKNNEVLVNFHDVRGRNGECFQTWQNIEEGGTGDIEN